MLNNVTLIGHVGGDPETKTFTNGDEIVIFSLATSERWKDKETGERKEKSEWHRIVVFQKHLVPIVKQYVKKGSKLYVEGQLTYRKWDDNGVEKTMAEIALKMKGKIVMLDKSERSGPPDDSYTGEY